MKSRGVIVRFLGTFLVVKSSFGQQDIVASLNSLSVPATRVSVTPPPKPILKVAVYFPEQFDLSILLSAEKVTTEVFRQSHVDVDWLNCPGARLCDEPAEALQFRVAIHSRIEEVVKDRAQARLMIEHDSLGFAIPCGVTDTVCLSYIFYSPIKRMALVEGTNVAVILGHVIAHEIGHALLDSNAHTHQGIMQGKLPIADLERFLYFTSQQSKHIVASLVARNQLQKK